MKKSTFQRKHRKTFKTNELNRPSMLKAVQNWGSIKKLGGPDPPTPSGCALIVSKISRDRTTQALEHNHTQFVCNALWVWEPMQIHQSGCNVIKSLQAKNQTGSRTWDMINVYTFVLPAFTLRPFAPSPFFHFLNFSQFLCFCHQNEIICIEQFQKLEIMLMKKMIQDFVFVFVNFFEFFCECFCEFYVIE